jgi:Zn-dependent oligopeptidase
MITSVDFEAALKLIQDYKNQLISGIDINEDSQNRTINLKKQISSGTFKAVRNYYKKEYGILLDLDNLEAMDEKLLSAIDFDKLLNTRGFGRVGVYNFKRLLVFNRVIVEDILNK